MDRLNRANEQWKAEFDTAEKKVNNMESKIKKLQAQVVSVQSS